jgi:hypothetical protein
VVGDGPEDLADAADPQAGGVRVTAVRLRVASTEQAHTYFASPMRPLWFFWEVKSRQGRRKIFYFQ